MVETINLYWLTLKYWAGGATWAESYEVACRIIYWPGGNY